MMNWATTEEEMMLRASALPFFRKNLPISYLRQMREGKAWDRSLWKSMAELGWTGILTAEEYGGSDFGYRGLGAILEAAGRTLSPTPLISTVACAAPLIQRFGTEEQKQSFLPRIVAGESIIALAIEEGRRHDGIHIQLKAHSHGAFHQLDGRKALCLDADIADHILLFARSFGSPSDPEGVSCFLLPADAPGLTRENVRLIDGRSAAQLHFENVRVPDFALLGPLGGAHEAYKDLCDAAGAALAADMYGSAAAAFEAMLAYLKERQQFAVPIGSFQALQHRMAMMFCELRMAEAAVIRALTSLDEREAERSRICSVAKATLGDVLHRVATEALQMHGGIGMTDEHDIGLFLKRSRISSELFGSARYHRDAYASALNF